ncbi:MAG: hypothetical protein M3R15_00750 [Acidobacteriota bacterium]|nr:hypothetical protein [Acidobacteriota bacterium]
MREVSDEGRELERIVVCLSKFHAAVERSGILCPLCKQRGAHDAECPIEIAWSLLDQPLQDSARAVVHSMFVEKVIRDNELSEIVRHKFDVRNGTEKQDGGKG